MKEVKRGSLLDIVFSSIDSGKTTKEICKENKLSKQKLQYYLDNLKKDGAIKKIGYGVWQTSKDRVANLCRGHGFMWYIKLPHEIKEWDKQLEKKGINYKRINRGFTYQIYFKDNKIWLSKNSLIIYDIHSYFGSNAIESRKYSFFELKSILNGLELKLGINLRTKEGNFMVRPARQHYSLIKNCLAIQCNKEGKKINVYNEKGIWFTIDNSFNLDEAETIHPKTALTDSLGIQKYFNEHKETKFEITPKFILNSFNQMIAIQLETNKQLLEYKEQNRQHLSLIKDYRKENIAWRKGTIKEIKEELKHGKQTKLFDF